MKRERHPPQGIQGGLEHQLRYLTDLFWTLDSFSGALNADGISAVPIQVLVRCTVEAIGMTMAQPALGNIRMGIYEDNGDDPRGGALLVEAAMVALGDRRNEVAVALTQLDPGLYWLAYHQSADETYISPYRYSQLGGALQAYSFNLGAFGALPDPFPAGAVAADRMPCMYVMIASVP